MSHMAILRFESDGRRARAFRAAIGKIVGTKYGLMTSESATLRSGDRRKVLAAESNEAQTRNITWRVVPTMGKYDGESCCRGKRSTRSQSALSFDPGKPDRRSFR